MAPSRPPATYVSDLHPNRVATLEATVVHVEEVREVAVAGGATKKVRNVRLRDATGEIVLVLWGQEVDLVKGGEKVRITEGWVKDYKGRLQISLGRTGTITKLPSSPAVPVREPRRP